jgi:tetratricopeptide (TPR) repeat protein
VSRTHLLIAVAIAAPLLLWPWTAKAQTGAGLEGAPPADSAKSLSPSGAKACPVSDVLLWRARRYLQRRDILQALTVYSRAVTLDPTCASALLELARLRAQLGDMVEADRLYARALRQSGARAQIYRERALVRRRQGYTMDAADDLRAAIEHGASDLATLRLLASWYVELRAWPAALAQYRVIVQMLSDSRAADELGVARVQLRALVVMAAETDPVLNGADSDNWVRRSMSHLLTH